MGHVEGEVVGVAFDEAFAVGLARVGGILPTSVAVLRPREGAVSVEEVPVVQSPLPIDARQVIGAQGGRGPVDGPVVVGVFQGCRGSG